MRRGQPLVLTEQRVRLLDLRAESLLERRYHVRLGRQGPAMPGEMVKMRRRLLAEVVGVSGQQMRRLAEVVEVVMRGQSRRLAVVIEVVVGRDVGVAEQRRWRLVTAAAAARREGVGQRITVAAGHQVSPEPYR